MTKSQEYAFPREFTITWYRNAFSIKTKKGDLLTDLGYCSHGKGVAFVVVRRTEGPATIEDLRSVMWQDVCVDLPLKLCSDARWCFNLDCSLNKAELEHFKKYGVRDRKDLEMMHSRFKEYSKKLGLKGEDFGKIVTCFETPFRLIKKRKGHRPSHVHEDKNPRRSHT